MIALTAGTAPAHAQIINWTGTTQGCFGAACVPGAGPTSFAGGLVQQRHRGELGDHVRDLDESHVVAPVAGRDECAGDAEVARALQAGRVDVAETVSNVAQVRWVRGTGEKSTRMPPVWKAVTEPGSSR
jgi:hypothetical protein